ncbi:hypothetical protein [Tahibacter sp.]|uniref:hypothetical protein n=1 Tax=Tahibacter sp. TaxID=2056211 RepID=UPI0028C4C90E|nr:hypothetical protein [Tahibacter sp.]
MTQAKCGRKSFLRVRAKRIAGPLFLALALCLACHEKRCEAAGVAVSIHLDADSVEIIRGLRRANGIDPPDSAADQRLAIVLTRASDRRREHAVGARLPVKLPLAPASQARASFIGTAPQTGAIVPGAGLSVVESRNPAFLYVSRGEIDGCQRYSRAYP